MVHQQVAQVGEQKSERKMLRRLKKTFPIRSQKVKAKKKTTLDLIFSAEQLINIFI